MLQPTVTATSNPTISDSLHDVSVISDMDLSSISLIPKFSPVQLRKLAATDCPSHIATSVENPKSIEPLTYSKSKRKTRRKSISDVIEV